MERYMTNFAKAAICGVSFALAGLCTAHAGQATATSAPMSLLGTNPPHASHHTMIPYTAQAALPPADRQALPALRASAEIATPARADEPPAGKRVTYKRGADGSFVKTYVAESGTN
jgi:hypothetical protein